MFKKTLNILEGYSEYVNRRRTATSWPKEEMTKGKTFINKTLHRKRKQNQRTSNTNSTKKQDALEGTLVTHLVIGHERGKDRKVLATIGTCPCSFVIQIFHNDQPSDRKHCYCR